MKWMYGLLIGLCLVCASCGNSTSNTTSASASNSIAGILTSVNVFREDDKYQGVFLTFDDGRTIRLRVRYDQMLNPILRVKNTFTYDSSLMIQEDIVDLSVEKEH